MSTSYGQYGEDEFLRKYFNGERGGFLVDVGASNGEKNSNSRMLLTEFGWQGILIEPEPQAFSQLAKLYAGREDVLCVCCGVARKPGVNPFHVSGQLSTFSTDFRRRAVGIGKEYTPPFPVLCRPLRHILTDAQCPQHINFLSIDCEGLDEQVVLSMDWTSWIVDLVIIEGVTPKVTTHLQENGIVRIGETKGNRIFARRRLQ